MATQDDYFDKMINLAQYNNTWSASQAMQQMDFQERMSNTAHQREVADLKAAGLNPVLSAGGQGSSVPAGSMGSTDMSTVGALSNIVGALISQNTAVQVANINASAAVESANIHAAASQYAADRSFEAQERFSNSWAGIVSRIIDSSGVSGLWNNIFSMNDEKRSDILSMAYKFLTGKSLSSGSFSISNHSSTSHLQNLWTAISGLNSGGLKVFTSWLSNLYNRWNNYSDPRRP